MARTPASWPGSVSFLYARVLYGICPFIRGLGDAFDNGLTFKSAVIPMKRDNGAAVPGSAHS